MQDAGHVAMGREGGYRARGGCAQDRAKRPLVCWVQALERPWVQVYGAQPPIELLRQCVDSGGWYDWEEKGTPWKEVEDMVLCAAMGQPGGGRSFTTPRFIRHFNQVSFVDLEDTTMSHIFGTILKWHFGTQGFLGPVASGTELLTAATLAVYNSSVQELRPTPSKSHYLFNLRDFSRVVQGMLLVRPEQCETKTGLLRLWVHEVWRVFGDRLTTPEDRDQFHARVKGIAEQGWELDFNSCLR